MIYDCLHNVPVYSGEALILPAEALLASVEVKSRLTQQELTKSVMAAAKLKKLRPFKRDLISGARDAESSLIRLGSSTF